MNTEERILLIKLSYINILNSNDCYFLSDELKVKLVAAKTEIQIRLNEIMIENLEKGEVYELTNQHKN